jgi:hypothetical protein
MSSDSKRTETRPDGPQRGAPEAKAMSVCPSCGGKIRFNAKLEGRTVACPRCGKPLTLCGITEFPLDQSLKPDRVSKVAGWVTSVSLHVLVILSFTGITWYSGLGTGAAERGVAIVGDAGDAVESSGGELSGMEPRPVDLTPPATTQGVQTIDIAGSEAPANVQISLGSGDGGLVGPAAGDWGSLGASTGEAGGGGASFFGLAARGSKFVFVVDRSGSMGNDRKLEEAKKELMRSVYALERASKFFIIFYETGFQPMPANGLVPATVPNKNTYLGWVEGIRPGGNTHPSQAMLKALALKPDAIWLLSDGEFNENIDVPDLIRTNNPGAKVQIHTIAFHSDAGAPALQRIAEENRGTYKFVGQPTQAPSNLFRRRRP